MVRAVMWPELEDSSRTAGAGSKEEASFGTISIFMEPEWVVIARRSYRG